MPTAKLRLGSTITDRTESMSNNEIEVEINWLGVIAIFLLFMLLCSCRSRPFDYLLDGKDSKFDLASAIEPMDAPSASYAAPGKHPFFNDKGTLKWYRDANFDKALKSGKHLILEVGRKQCGLCQKFVEEVLPLYKKRLTKYAGVESNVDKMHSTIRATVLKYMKHATLLPVIIVINNKGKYVGGIYGDIRKQRNKFKALLDKCDK